MVKLTLPGTTVGAFWGHDYLADNETNNILIILYQLLESHGSWRGSRQGVRPVTMGRRRGPPRLPLSRPVD